MDRNLALEFVRVTEAAAISAAAWIGRGKKNAADRAAVDAMRSRLKKIHFKGTVVIGEGQKDEAPELFSGEVLGEAEEPRMDLAVDPLECTDSVAHGRYNALSVIAAGKKGTFLSAPDTYMDKLAVGKEARDVVDLEAPVADNVRKTAKALGKDVREITVLVLDRPRHEKLINDIRSVGARVRLITDGDVAGGIAPCFDESGIDMLLGIGASTEAVLAAAAIRILEGQIYTRFHPLKERDHKLLSEFGITDIKKIYSRSDLVSSDEVTFTATGVIDGPLLEGVRVTRKKIITHSIVMRGISKTIRYITTFHHET